MPSYFDIVTPKRKYFLVTDSEREMIQWVENICQACGFKSEDDEGELLSDLPSTIVALVGLGDLL